MLLRKQVWCVNIEGYRTWFLSPVVGSDYDDMVWYGMVLYGMLWYDCTHHRHGAVHESRVRH